MGKLREMVPELVEEGLKLAKGSMIYGVRVEELDEEELLAMMALGWGMYTKILSSKGADYK